MTTIRLLFIVMLGLAVGLPARSYAQESKSSGAVFVMTNAAERNEVIAYKRNADGSLEEGRSFPTGGRGSGGTTDPLGSQGSLSLTRQRAGCRRATWKSCLRGQCRRDEQRNRFPTGPERKAPADSRLHRFPQRGEFGSSFCIVQSKRTIPSRDREAH